MDHLHLRNDSNFYSQSQPDLIHNSNMNGLSINNNNSSTGYAQHSPNMASSAPSRTSRLPRPKPASEEWKRSSTSVASSNKPKQMESWKMSGKPRHAQLANIQQLDQDPRSKRQSAPIFNSPSWQNPKPLPVEPVLEPFNVVHQPLGEESHYTTHTALHPPFHVAVTPMQQPAFINRPPPPPQDFYAQNYPPPFMNGQPSQEYYSPYVAPQPIYNEYPPVNSYPYNNEYPPTMDMHPPPPPPPPVDTMQHAVSLQDPPVPKTPEKITPKKKDPATAKPEKKVRQITVQSINAEHRVWIDVLPAETGLSLAEKIHIIATFRTRKIVSIETASGRKVPLDNRPVFGSWMDMESFEDGERWTVEWRENDRGVVDRFMSKIVQAGGGKRSKDHVAKE